MSYGDKCRRKDKCAYKHKSSDTQTNLRSQVDEKAVKVLQNENEARQKKIDLLERELEKIETVKADLDNTLETSEWKETLQNLKSLEMKLMNLEERVEASEGTS